MKVSGISLLSLLTSLNAALASSFYNVTVFDPPSTYTGNKVFYPRVSRLSNGNVLVTWANSSPGPALRFFPIFKSTDGAKSWEQISQVNDTVNGFGMSAQPFLYQLPVPIGSFTAGTVLAAGNSIGPDTTNLDLYASRDLGVTWTFVSHMAQGGPASTVNGITPVWEPFLMAFEDKVIVMFSDQGDPEYGQKLAHKSSSDLINWGTEVNDVTYPTYTDRPGMSIVAQHNGNYILTYEYATLANPSNASDTSMVYPVHYKISRDPTQFDPIEGIALVSNLGTVPNASPYVAWSPFGGRDGTILVDDADHGQLFINRAGGDPSKWTELAVPISNAYTRSITVLDKAGRYILVVGGAIYGTTNGTITSNVVDLAEWLH